MIGEAGAGAGCGAAGGVVSEVVANGEPRREHSRHGWTTWRWTAREPMASYLATIDIGAWDVTTWRTDAGLQVYDAVDPAITGGLRAEIDSPPTPRLPTTPPPVGSPRRGRAWTGAATERTRYLTQVFAASR